MPSQRSSAIVFAILVGCTAFACGDGDSVGALDDSLPSLNAETDPNVVGVDPPPPPERSAPTFFDSGEDAADAASSLDSGEASAVVATTHGGSEKDGGVHVGREEVIDAAQADADEGADADGGADLDADAQADAERGADADDAESGMDADAEASTDADAEAGLDADADAEAAVDSSTDADANTAIVPPSDSELDQRFLERLRTCGYLGAGEFGVRPTEDAFGRCVINCALQTACPALRRVLCREGTDNVYQQCLTNCGRLPRESGFVCGSLTVWPSWRCNGNNDCRPTGEDEQGCAGYTCRSGQVLTNDYARCDGRAQCSDRSDEEGCAPVCPEAGVTTQ